MLDRLTLDQLRTLVVVAETGSFSAAGRSLMRVQSAVSQTIQALETTLGLALFDRSKKSPVLTDAGKSLLEDARRLVAGADALRARAESIASDVEPELTLAVESVFPNAVLMESLKVLTEAYPRLPVTVFTESLGGGEQRLRDGTARLGLYPAIRPTDSDFVTELLVGVPMAPVVAMSHPLAQAKEPVGREVLQDEVQLVLTDRTQITARFSAGVISRRVWRFADLATRLDFLLAGFGWCNMPVHMVDAHIKAGRLKRLRVTENDAWAMPIHLVHPRNRPPGQAGRMLISVLRERLVSCGVAKDLAPPPAAVEHGPVKRPKAEKRARRRA